MDFLVGVTKLQPSKYWMLSILSCYVEKGFVILFTVVLMVVASAFKVILKT